MQEAACGPQTLPPWCWEAGVYVIMQHRLVTIHMIQHLVQKLVEQRIAQIIRTKRYLPHEGSNVENIRCRVVAKRKDMLLRLDRGFDKNDVRDQCCKSLWQRAIEPGEKL